MDDWDLHAVVRGCAATTSTSTSSNTCISSPTQAFSATQKDYNFSRNFSEDGLEKTRFEDLYDIYQPFTTKLPQKGLISPLSVLGGRQDLSSEPELPQKGMNSQAHNQTELIRPEKPQIFCIDNDSKAANLSHSNSPKLRKRKNVLKKVCHVAAEKLACDVWSWRKYGQKPIKGSPYPRGYYKCSTIKGCVARKQVERNRSDPRMFIVTYTGEHKHAVPSHQNSLSTSIRQKPNAEENSKIPSSPPSPQEEHFCVSNKTLDDDFFEGLEGIVGSNEDCLMFPWPTTTIGAIDS